MDVHFYTGVPVGFHDHHGGINGYTGAWWALHDPERTDLHTTQLALLREPLLMSGHRVFINIPLDEEFEIRLGVNERTRREIREGHNLLALLLNGEFGSIL